ncbi:MAG: oxidoreductase [Ignavibacteriaceae bacterium]|nr:MAG: SDR family oxidoreductase [Chlorobiota bacterium]GJQ31468.1 MAG: oxidoreductase [Ignavibacteriaceae bacterium]
MQKHFVLAGTTSGIGLDLANRLLAAGHKVTGLARRESQISHPDYTHIQTDLVDQSAALPKIEGSVDGYAYALGSINLRPFKALSLNDFQNELNINLLGAVRTIQHLLPNLKQAGKASIVLFSTIAVQTGMSYHASIASAKGAVEGLTRSLAAEFAPAIRVNAIAPSLTNTPLAGKLLSSPEKVEASDKRHPLGRIGQPEDISSAAEFLLSDASSWITGQILHVDGGMSAVRPL